MMKDENKQADVDGTEEEKWKTHNQYPAVELILKEERYCLVDFYFASSDLGEGGLGFGFGFESAL